MSNSKFELLTDQYIEVCGRKLFRIRALVSFGIVSKGDVGGYVENESNLEVYGDAWVYDDVRVYGNARVYGDAQVYGDAWVSGDAHWLLIGPIGSRMSMMTVTADARIGLRVTTGCFSGSLAEFEAAIAATHGDNEHAIHYRAAIALIRARFPEQAKAVAA